jgi:hypothetical protein
MMNGHRTGGHEVPYTVKGELNVPASQLVKPLPRGQQIHQHQNQALERSYHNQPTV